MLRETLPFNLSHLYSVIILSLITYLILGHMQIGLALLIQSKKVPRLKSNKNPKAYLSISRYSGFFPQSIHICFRYIRDTKFFLESEWEEFTLIPRVDGV